MDQKKSSKNNEQSEKAKGQIFVNIAMFSIAVALGALCITYILHVFG